MPLSLPRLWHLAKPFLLLGCQAAACSHGQPEAHKTIETPEAQFIVEGMHMEERNTNALWRMKARRAEGGLAATRLYDATLTYIPKAGTRDIAYTMRTPLGTMDFDEGSGTFRQVQISEPQGSLLHAGTAEYDRTAKTVSASGPLRFEAPGIVARAPLGVLHLKDNRMEIQGPVVGRFEPRPLSPPTRRSPAPPPPPPPY